MDLADWTEMHHWSQAKSHTFLPFWIKIGGSNNDETTAMAGTIPLNSHSPNPTAEQILIGRQLLKLGV